MNDEILNEVYLFKLDKAHKQFKKYKTQLFKSNGIDITSDQWVLLKTISENEGLTQRELATKSFKEPASITRTLDLMERKMMVSRMKLDDRRSYGIYITKSGKKLIKKILPLAKKIRKKGLEGISKKKVIELNIILDRIYENLS